MNKTNKSVLTFLGIGVLVYVALRIIQKKPIFGSLPEFEVMRDSLWESQVANNPALGSLKQFYFTTEGWKDKGFITEWYKAFKSGKDVFKYKGRTWVTKTGLGA